MIRRGAVLEFDDILLERARALSVRQQALDAEVVRVTDNDLRLEKAQYPNSPHYMGALAKEDVPAFDVSFGNPYHEAFSAVHSSPDKHALEELIQAAMHTVENFIKQKVIDYVGSLPPQK